MFFVIKDLIRRFVYSYKCDSNSYIQHLREIGMKIGDNCMIYAPTKTTIDETVPFVVEIGNNVSITEGVVILAHDYSYSILNEVYGDMPCPCKTTIIGNNCFIGMKAIILNGANIGNNCIIGAGAVVSGKVPDNSVYCGNPGRVVCTLEEYHERKVAEFEEAARVYVTRFQKAYGRIPDVSEMGVYISLFLPREEENRKYFSNIKTRMNGAGENLFKLQPKYNGYEEFIETINLKK